MESTTSPPRNKTAVALGLLVASLVALGIGGFVRLDDADGNLPSTLSLGGLALVLAVASLVYALPDPTSRRTVGGALAALDVLIVALSATGSGFRFIWMPDEGEFFLFAVGLGLTALVLLTPRFRVAGNDGLSAWARTALYLCGLAVAMFVAFGFGVSHFEATECSGPDFGGECDLAGVEGLLWSAGTLLLGVVAIIVVEVRRARRKKNRPRTRSLT